MGANRIPENLTIGEVAIRFGVSPRTLRLYEQRGLLTPARYNHERLYSTREVQRLQVILLGKRLGFTLDEIYQLSVKRQPSAAAETGPDQLDLSEDEILSRLGTLIEKSEAAKQALNELRASLSKRK